MEAHTGVLPLVAMDLDMMLHVLALTAQPAALPQVAIAVHPGLVVAKKAERTGECVYRTAG
jgi:hypothetical protein